MRKIILSLMAFVFMVSNSFATCTNPSSPGWNKSLPQSCENPQAISPDVVQNNTALDLMLQNYRDGYVTITLASTSLINIGPGGVMLQNSDGSVRLMVANSTITAVSPTNIDIGVISPSTTYYLYAFAASVTATTFSVLFSASPTNPAGLTYYHRLGSFTTNSSSNFNSVLSDTSPAGGFTAWAGATFGTPALAATDGFVMGYCGNTGSSNTAIEILSDASGSPSTVRCYSSISTNTGGVVSCFSPVIKGQYYEIVGLNGCTGSPTGAYFMSLGI